jgi:putative photosynthetic complex assembly protein 2
MDIALAALFAVFAWWFSTGLVLLLNRLPRDAAGVSVVLSSLIAGVALVALAHTARQTSVAAAYCAFTCALLVWGWHELTFLSGWLTGPRKTAAPAGARGLVRFAAAVQAIAWHELAIAAAGLFIVAITWGAPNQAGTLTFLVLWAMRTSAKLNLFWGVRNLSEEFLPPHLAYLQTHFRRRRMNRFFPLSMLLAALALVWLVQALAHATSAGAAAGLTLAAAMLALAIIEHAMLVLPVNTTALWRWAMTPTNG